ncbi:uncharacterized protein LOC128683690 [Plodia interpunctella]|uniref:uncharacterized protein LOC128683690 n=1 Tax=Plodia interpunctella TaxID=58824 RepID=UPI002367493A|nr:uncharacterized protein LOC128683690 [Plodia interpunctella]
MSSPRWTADKNIKFINEYQRKECLWDPKHPQYKNRYAREAAYKKIMEVMQMEHVKDVIGRIRILRNTFNNETLKAKKCSATGMPIYVSKIPWLSHMDFLKNIDGHTREYTNTENVTSNFIKEASDSEPETEEITVPTNKGKTTDPLLLNAVEVDILEKFTPQRLSYAGNDEFDLFGQTIAQQLRQMPLECALETEEMILATIRRQRVGAARLIQPSQASSLESTSSCFTSVVKEEEYSNGYNNDQHALMSSRYREIN